MRLLVYSHAFAPQVGGVETFSMRLAEALPEFERQGRTDKIRVTVVTQTEASQAFDDSALPFSAVRKPGLVALWRLVGEADAVLLSGPALLPLLFSILRLKKLVITHHGYQTICPSGLLLFVPTQTCCPGYFRKKRYIQCVRCGTKETSLSRSVLRTLLTFPRRMLCSFADQNVAVSDHLARRIQLRKLVVIRNGVPEARLPELEPASRPSSKPRFLFLGRMVPEKGVPILIQAAKILKDRGRNFRILLVGDGPEKARSESLAAQLKVEDLVEFLGFKTGEELQAILDKPSIAVIPSIWEDVAPFVPLEQMMNGKAIIAADIGGLSEEVGDAGLKFIPNDAKSLADQMEKCIQDPQLAPALGKRARTRAIQLYSEKDMIPRYADLLRPSSST